MASTQAIGQQYLSHEPTGLSSLLYSGRSGHIAATPANWLQKTETFVAPLSSTPTIDSHEAAVAAHTQSVSVDSKGTSRRAARVKSLSYHFLALHKKLSLFCVERSSKKHSTKRPISAVEKALRLIRAAEKKPKSKKRGKNGRR